MKKVFLFLASCLVAFAASAETYSVTIKYSQLSWNQNAAGDMEAIITLPSISSLTFGDIVNFTLTGGNSNIPFYNIAIVDNADEDYDWWHELSRWDDYLEINSSGTGTVPILIHDDCWGSNKIVACLVYPPTYDYIIKNGLIYDIKDGNNVCLRGCSNSVTSGEISIPTALSFKGVTYTVTSIGDNAFRGRGITSLTIPNSVLEIGNYAFAKCSDLTSIAIPEGVTTIGEYAFEDVRTVIYSGNAAGRPWGARAVIATVDGNYEYVDIEKSIIHKYIGNEKNVKIPSNVSMIGDNAFRNCTSITSITIPNSVLGIGYSAFSGCSNLTSITIPNSVTSIDYYAFEGCEKLISIIIPNNVTTIGGSAFSGCTNLKSLVIGEKVESIGENAFNGCSSLSKITCYAVEPPTVDASSFSNYNGYFTIPCDNFEAYDIHSVWGTFKHVDCLSAESVDIEKDAVVVEPDVAKAAFSMPINEDANSYTLTISNNGEVFCSITFNAQGQLANIDFSTTKSYELKSDVAAYQFTVTGLSAATAYGYSFKALNKSKAVLKEYTGTFTTKNEDGSGGSVQGGSAQGEQGGQGSEQGGEQTVTKYTVVLAVNNTSYGSVMGAGEYAEGAKATLIAIPATGYRFVQWNDGNTENPRIITLSANVSYVANFEQASSGGMDYTVTAIPANNEQGTVVGGGVYEPLSTVTLAVVPAKGYQFVSWNDGNTDNPRTITVISNSFYVATFEKISTAIDDVVVENVITISNRQILVNGEAPAFVVTVSGQKIANANLKAGVYFVVVDGGTVGISVR